MYNGFTKQKLDGADPSIITYIASVRTSVAPSIARSSPNNFIHIEYDYKRFHIHEGNVDFFLQSDERTIIVDDWRTNS